MGILFPNSRRVTEELSMPSTDGLTVFNRVASQHFPFIRFNTVHAIAVSQTRQDGFEVSCAMAVKLVQRLVEDGATPQTVWAIEVPRLAARRTNFSWVKLSLRHCAITGLMKMNCNACAAGTGNVVPISAARVTCGAH